MVNVTLSIPEDLKQRMDLFAEINWSAVAREAFDEKIKDLEFIKRFKAKSRITEEDAMKWGAGLNKNLAKRRIK
ncbi:hypothetical protein J4401_03585 [Candidatus Woesearchaeota archaeon]|nr:hypothetical protein [Candidatus Woesearchaeota archaeon]